MSPPCPFCDPDERVVCTRGDHALVLFARGPIVPGHLLVVTRAHVPAVAVAPVSVQEEVAALERWCGRVNRQVFGRGTLVFEHARDPVGTGNSDSYCHHAHRNVIPDHLPADGLDRLGRMLALRCAGTSPPDATVASLGRRDVYRVETDTRSVVVRDDGGHAPPRLLRRALADVLSLDPGPAVEWERHGAEPWTLPWAAEVTSAFAAAATDPEDVS
jgi:hypothetical protein